MATKQTDVKKLIEDRILSTDVELGKIKVGTDEYSRAIKDEAALVRAYADLEKNKIQAEDNEAKRKEQERMNDAELENKETQIQIEYMRAVADKEYKIRQNRITFLECIRGMFTYGASTFMAKYYADKAFKAEYEITDGASKQLPRPVEGPIKGLIPRKNF